MENFVCVFCQKTYPVDPFQTFCPECHEPLLCKGSQNAKKFRLDMEHPLEKMMEFLPLEHVNHDLGLGEGNTPLIELKNTKRRFQLPSLYAKNETVNPTLSFKDRGTALAVQKTKALGIEEIGTVSTGNMAVSTAAYGAKSGLKTYVLIKEGAHPEIFKATGVYHPVMISVKGDYGELYRKSISLGRTHNIYFANSMDPFRIEGYKVTGFEIYFQLNKKIPDFIFVPVSSGGHLIGIIKAFDELLQQGFIRKVPHFVGVQAEGCSPIARAFQDNKSRVERITKAETIAKAIANPDPPGGNHVLRMIKRTGGTILSTPDEKILEAQKILSAYEGIFVQPASATVLAGLLEFMERERLDPEAKVVMILTGSGMKALEKISLDDSYVVQASIPELPNILRSIRSR